MKLPVAVRRPPLVHAMAIAVASLCATLPATLGAQTTLGAATPSGLDCLIQPSQTVQVGTASAGVVDSVRAERGDYVRKGQVLVQLQNSVERAALAMAREKADQLGEVRATRSASELAKAELKRAEDLVKENFVSRTYFDRQRAELEVASGRGQQAEERRRLATREVELASAQLAQRTVLAPVDGVVVERFISPGEYVEQKPVMRIAQVDPLRVDVLVPAVAFGQVAVGSKAQVTPEMLNRRALTATVSGVDRVIDAASHTFRVRLELANPGGKLPPGLRCKADLLTADGKPLITKEAVGAAAAVAPGQAPKAANTVVPVAAPLPITTPAKPAAAKVADATAPASSRTAPR
jgi:membrane fusion protein, heavy metal efflux system